MKNLLILAMMLIAGGAAADDILVLRDGTVMDVKVTQVSDWEVSYKKTEHPDGPLFSTDVSKILSIRYENGTEQKFEDAANKPATIEPYKQKANKGFSIHAGRAFPTGDFIVDGDGSLSATTGFSVGIKNVFPIAETNWGLFLSADLIYNGSDYEYDYEYDDCKTPSIMNIPVLLGVNYKYNINPKTAFWTEFGIGPNFRIISPMEIMFNDYDYEVGLYNVNDKMEFDTAVSIACQFGAGFMINDKFSAGLHYYSTGKVKVNAENIITLSAPGYIPYSESSQRSAKIAANVFMIRLGYHF